MQNTHTHKDLILMELMMATKINFSNSSDLFEEKFFFRIIEIANSKKKEINQPHKKK